MMDILNDKFGIPNWKATQIHERISGQCESCQFKKQLPKNPPTTPIISLNFGERILVDLKQLHTGYMIVAVDHWSNYCWLGYLDTKEADGVASFLTNTVFKEVEATRKSWKAAAEEADADRTGNKSFPVNSGFSYDEGLKTCEISLYRDHDGMLEVRLGDCYSGKYDTYVVVPEGHIRSYA